MKNKKKQKKTFYEIMIKNREKEKKILLSMMNNYNKNSKLKKYSKTILFSLFC